MNKKALLYSLMLLAAPAAFALDDGPHVVKSDINAEADNAELCLEFDKPLAPVSGAKLTSDLKLEADGKAISVSNIAVAGTSLCLFPLERGPSYRLELSNIRALDDTKMGAPYKSSFAMPDRSPLLAFTNGAGGNGGFASYDSPLTLRAVNVAHAKMELYRVSDPAAMARAWQDRAQTVLAPSESAYLARTKGQQVWTEEASFNVPANTTFEQNLAPGDKWPDLAPGLYLIIVDAATKESAASKGLTPLAASWFVKSDFSLRAIRDENGIHVFAARRDAPEPKTGLKLVAMNDKGEQTGAAETGGDGIGMIAADAQKNDITLIASDAGANIAFASPENLPALSGPATPGAIHASDLFSAPGDGANVVLTLAQPASLKDSSLLRLTRPNAPAQDFIAPALNQGDAKLSFPAPAAQGIWSMRWQRNDGAVLAENQLRVTANAEAPHLQSVSSRDTLTADGGWPVSVKALSGSGRALPLVAGHVSIAWQKLDPALLGWKDYAFGVPTTLLDTYAPVGDFVTDLDGQAQLHLPLPPKPAEPGLYQAALKIVADSDAGITAAPVLIAPLHPDATVIGIKPVGAVTQGDARYAQNSIARFSVIGLGADGKPQGLQGLSYQIYAEGRHFTWYQDEGRWKYRQAAQLRPIGGGALSIRADGGSVLEWPVTAGNYRLEIMDASGKLLAQTAFSAGWDSGATAAAATPLAVAMPKLLQPGHETAAHIDMPQAGTLTVILADTRIRKIVHETRPRGEATISFTPGADWGDKISLSAQADMPGREVARATVDAALGDSKNAETQTMPGISILAADAPEALVLRKDGSALLTFAVENKDAAAEEFHYAFSVSPGVKIDGADKGAFTLGGRQSHALSLAVSAAQPGARDIRLDVVNAHGVKASRSWTISVLPRATSLRSAETLSIAPKQPFAARPRGANEGVAFVARRPMEGLGELLSALFEAEPFTTRELGLSIDALRQWGAVMAQAGIAPENLIAARRRMQIEQMLRHQNEDGGFGRWRGGGSTILDTAAALTALGPEKSDYTASSRNLAIGWLKQQLANTWVDDKERATRARAYAALAAADALEPASLHYFSDTSASAALPAVAEADIAASFKHMRDPDAAAFWIKKMLDENSHAGGVELLNALAATDALSSDAVHAAMTATLQSLRQGAAPKIADIAGLLRAISADNADAGRAHVVNGNDQHDIAGAPGVMVLHAADFGNWRNNDAQNLSITFLAETETPPPAPPQEFAVARHIYRLNGVELAAPARPKRNEPYVIELKGKLPDLGEDDSLLVQDGGNNGLRFMNCPLPPGLDTLSFMPWLETKNSSPVAACEFSAHEMNALLAPDDGDRGAFTAYFFARIDVPSLSDIPAPRMRILKSGQ